MASVLPQLHLAILRKQANWDRVILFLIPDKPVVNIFLVCKHLIISVDGNLVD